MHFFKGALLLSQIVVSDCEIFSWKRQVGIYSKQLRVVFDDALVPQRILLFSSSERPDQDIFHAKVEFNGLRTRLNAHLATFISKIDRSRFTCFIEFGNVYLDQVFEEA